MSSRQIVGAVGSPHRASVSQTLPPYANRAGRHADLSCSRARPDLLGSPKDCLPGKIVEASVSTFAGFALFPSTTPDGYQPFR
jgi:hypothetical protein